MSTTELSAEPPLLDVGRTASVERRDPWWELARLVGLVLAALVVVGMVGRLDQVLGMVLLAMSMAMLTAPVRRGLATHLPTGLATAVTALVTLATILVLGALVMRGLGDHADRLATEIGERLDRLRPGTLPARIADALQAQAGVDEVFGRLPSVVVAGEESSSGVGRRVIDVLLVVILAAFFQGSGSRALDLVAGQWPRSARSGVRDFVGDVVGRGAGYARRLGMLGLAAWAVGALAASIVDLPAPVLVGAWLAMWTAIPWVGPWLAAVPYLVLGLVEGTGRGIAATLLAVVIAIAVGVARRRYVEPRTMRLGAAPTALAFACGTSIGGFGGVVVCLTIAALVGAVVTSTHRVSRPSSSPTAPEEIERSTGSDPTKPSGADALVVSTTRGIALAPGWRGAAVVLGAVLVGSLSWILVGALGGVVVWMVIAMLIAVALNRPVSWIQRRVKVPRPIAIGIVSMIGLLVVVGASALGMAGGAASGDELSRELPKVVEDLGTLPVVGPWLEERQASEWVSEQLADLPQRLGEARSVGEFLPTIGARLVDAFWVLVLAVALLVDGPRLAANIERRVPARFRRQTVRLRNVSHAAVGGYLAGAALVAGINAVVVLVIGLGVGIALAPVLAVWAFAWNFIPQIGGFMGGLPLVVLALAEGPMRAVIAGLLFLTYQLIENHLIQPAVIGEAIDVPAWAALLAALAGAAAFGLVGAVALTPLVGVVRVIMREVRRDDFPGATSKALPSANEHSP